MIRVVETFLSLQGEGRLTGTPSFFIRVGGCHLRCRYCDTAYACSADAGSARSVESLLDEAAATDVSHVVLTGGEPMLYPELVALSQGLRDQGKHVTVETSGTLYQPVACDLMSISPKTSNSAPPPHFGDARRSHETRRFVPETLARLMAEYDYQLKFVVECPADCDEVQGVLRTLPGHDARRVLLMPEGVDLDKLRSTASWLEPHCNEQGFTFCPRRHIEWFGAGRGV